MSIENNAELDRKVRIAMCRTIDAVGWDLIDLYADKIIPKEEAREIVLDAGRIFVFGGMDSDTESYYMNLTDEQKQNLVEKAISHDLC